MSADLNTEITLNGSQKELLAFLKVLHNYQAGVKLSWDQETGDAMLQAVRVNGEQLSAIDEHALAGKQQLKVTAGGPYGHFYRLKDTKLFEALADAAPAASFYGTISGFKTGADISLDADFDGMLSVEDRVIFDEDEPSEGGFMEKMVPYHRFCKLFHFDEDDFDEDFYHDVMSEIGAENGFENVSYSDFQEICEECELEEEEYEQIVSQLEPWDDGAFYEYMDEGMEGEADIIKYTYDPGSGVYSHEDVSDASEDNGEDDDEDDECDDDVDPITRNIMKMMIENAKFKDEKTRSMAEEFLRENEEEK